MEEQSTVKISAILNAIKRSRHRIVKAVIAIALFVGLALMFPRGESIELDYKLGSVWAQKDLIAPFPFPIYREEWEYERDVSRARKSVYPVFERDTQVEIDAIDLLRKFMNGIQKAARLRSQLKRKGSDRSTAYDSSQFLQAAAGLEIPFTEQEWDLLSALASSGGFPAMTDVLVSAFETYLSTGILDTSKSGISRKEIALRKGNSEEIVNSSRLYDHNDIRAILEHDLKKPQKTDPRTNALAYKIGITFIRPNLKFNAAATELGARAAIDAVSRTNGFVQENERVVSKHERITPEIKLKLESLQRAKADRGSETDRMTQLLGVVLHVVMVVVLYGIYLYLFRKKIFWNNRRMALIALIILMEGFFAYLTRELNVNAPLEYLIFVPAASMLLTIIFDSRVGFYGTVIIAFLTAGIRGNDYTIALASLIAGALSVYTVRDVKNRTQIFRSLGFIALGYTVAILAIGMERFASIKVILEQLTFGVTNAIISPVLTYGLLIFFERVFKVTTDLTLMELSHFNHPLMRQLSEQAPGTYHHSMTMAGLAEAAALAVGANEVLARVGAYFHDVGKIVKPTYFVENQKGSRNKHDKLAPRMSSLIISAHVKDGIALAREKDLPEEVIDFIPMHHGTTRIEYFYNKALELAHRSDDETKVDEIKDQDYRYPGPKPQTKETGILMLADGIEASARTLEDPSPQKLEALIDEYIRKRFEEGELDECPLTLKDLTKIKAAFLSVLVGIYHTRVKYPAAAKKQLPEQTKPAVASTMSNGGIVRGGGA